ncbi:MAG: tetratricopeptide repeat protein [Acidobacteria bacterium]|nr:tetratricopeptide repeat protein [Acidobacteriota bacterium]
MKTKERHQLKENELAQMLAAARENYEKHKRVVTGILLVVIVVGAVVAGVLAWRGQTEARAEQLLGEAMVTFNARVIPVTAEPAAPGEVPAAATIGATGTFPTVAAKLNAALPKLKAAADAYPETEAGLTARYHYASSLAALGRHDEAVKAFDEVVARAGNDSLYGRMARLGKADTLVRAGQYDAAIATWKELASGADEALPKDAILMELGKAYQAAGNAEEARKTFTQLIDEHPTSPYTAEARAELGS